MYQYNHKRFSITLMASLLFGMIVFLALGTTLAYFHVEKEISGSVKIASMSFEWRNNNTFVGNSAIYTLAASGQLRRGDSNGTYILNASGEAGGNLNIKSGTTSADAYLRIRTQAIVDESVDVTQYFTFRYINESLGVNYSLGDVDYWELGTDGWYYYKDAETGNVISANTAVYVCNNLVLSGDFPVSYTGKEIKITFEYQAIQSANITISTVWGASAGTILG